MPELEPQICQAIVEDAPEAILVADRDGIIRFWNAASERLFGCTAAEAVGRSLDLVLEAERAEPPGNATPNAAQAVPFQEI